MSGAAVRYSFNVGRDGARKIRPGDQLTRTWTELALHSHALSPTSG
jgi:hypothetical protein